MVRFDVPLVNFCGKALALVDHATSMIFVGRELLACFCFVMELRWLWALLAAIADIGRNRSTSLMAYDASLAGFGISHTQARVAWNCVLCVSHQTFISYSQCVSVKALRTFVWSLMKGWCWRHTCHLVLHEKALDNVVGSFWKMLELVSRGVQTTWINSACIYLGEVVVSPGDGWALVPRSTHTTCT